MEIIDETERNAHIYPLKFWTDYEEGEVDELRPVDWVTWVKKGTQNGSETTDKIARDMKDEMKRGALELSGLSATTGRGAHEMSRVERRSAPRTDDE